MKCPSKSCHRTRSGGMLLCRSCWRRVPRPLRDEVWRTWRAFTNPNRSPEQRASIALAYRAAADAATMSVESVQA